MDDRIIQFRVGAVVICGLLVTGILILFSGDIDWIFKQPYTLYVDTPTAPGVANNTPVRKHGIRIGYVSNIESKDRGVRLTLKVDGGKDLYDTDVCKIGTASFLGDAVIDFLPGLDEVRGEKIQNGTLIAFDPDPRFNRVLVDINPVELITKLTEIDLSNVSETLDTLPEAIEAVRDAGRAIERAGDNVAVITERVRDIITVDDVDVAQIAKNIQELSAKAETALDNFNSVMGNVNAIVGDEEARDAILGSIKSAPNIFAEFETTIKETRETLDSFRQMADRADKNLRNIESFTDALGEQGPQFVEKLNTTFDGANEIVEQIKEFAESLNRSDGSLGKLLNDPQLYHDISATVSNVRDISFQLKPIIKDARYLMDGLARDPGQIVRGALDRRPNSTGYKGTYMGSGTNFYD
ncbi:MAG TPA: MlaD family protein [Pirellulaceae bacterium]|nr:MlaD family protein [Pirellulaceae bacterium]HMO92860.1 MlaD family protein [Pirellulaceae bacterium]HMP69398.1 MlaD family protein [Pirellulaceae bacterium]